jgi:hypothetical protein
VSHRMPPAYVPLITKADHETQRSFVDLSDQLNHPSRREFTASLRCDDANPAVQPTERIVPVGTYGGQTAVHVAGAANCTALVGASIAVNVLRAVPFYVGHEYPVTALACQVTTGVANAVARVGIYSAQSDLAGNFSPGSLLVASGAFDTSTNGVKRTTLTTPIALPVGRLYYAVYLAYTAAAQVNTIPVAGCAPLGQTNDGAFTTHLTVAYTTGSTLGLPVSFPAGSAVATTAPPAVYVTFGTPSRPVASVTRIERAPYLDGLVLRRVRLVKASALARGSSRTESVRVEATLGSGSGSIPVGSFDSTEGALVAYTPRVISDGNIDKDVPAGSVLSATITQVGWPKISMKDAVVLFDLYVR